MNLYRVARPLNRAASDAGRRPWWRCFVLMFLVPVGRDIFDLDTTEPWAYLAGAIAIAVAFPLLLLGGEISRRIAATGYLSKRRASKAAASS